jgi:hypothetical protein
MLHITRLFRPAITCSSFASQHIRLQSKSLHITFIFSSSSSRSFYSYQRKESSSPFEAHTRRHLRIHQYRLEDTLEISHQSSIIRQIRSVG